ncbi:hypothetical protein [Sideroxydans sp. CL21]|uniref:hypothetical protein n=1 Tax=Sideroxydans sp. CL21 TaxID=2600596 RepID=UPI0024BCFF9C|nr:hypothetical protein [Sideroxydans sp. CL21]
MGTHRGLFLVASAAAFLITGCTAIPQQHAVKEVHICDTEDCNSTIHKYTAGQLLTGFQKLLKANEDKQVKICESDPKTHACKSVGICQFVLGGLIPGSGCAEHIVFSETAIGNQTGKISLKANMPLTFLWTPVSCETTTVILSVHTPDEIYMDFKPRYCNWMMVGNMSATFNFAVESLDLGRGQIGGYWSHAVTGSGNGRGSGYAVLSFPKTMPDGDNWLVERPELPVPRSKLSGTQVEKESAPLARSVTEVRSN